MKGSICIGRIFGIKLFVHWTFLILVGWIFLMHVGMGHGAERALGGILFLLALFGCVTLHELGHALVARHYNFSTRHITLLPIGGIAQMDSLPEKPAQELSVALAGPLVNLVIAFLLYLYLYATGNPPRITGMIHLNHSDFWDNLFIANITLAVFNLIPAFPMDGGRVLRALLSFRMGRIRATKISAMLGQVLAIAFVFFGFFGNIWLIFMGVFIYLGAGGEALYETTRNAIAGLTIKDAMMRRYTVLSPHDKLATASQELLQGQDKEFLVGSENTVEGVLTRKNIIKGLFEFGPQAPIARVMTNDFLVLAPEMTLEDVYTKMTTNGYTISPVFENTQLVGAIDKENIMELIMIRNANKGTA